MTLAIPEKIYKIIKKNPEIKWTEVARQAIVRKVREIEFAKDPLRAYSLKRLSEDGEEADELFEF